MKLNIDFNKKEITLLGDWVLGDLHSKLKEICGNEEANWDSWTIKQEIKLINTSLLPPALPYSEPYEPFKNQPIVIFKTKDNTLYSDNITSTIDKITC